MDKNVFTLEAVFQGRLFKVPNYQRGFTWEKEQCLDLLNDLELLPSDYDHYTGTLVFHPNGKNTSDNEGSSYKRFDIVDGQQRLTSIVILLNQIKQKFSEKPEFQSLAHGIEKKYLFTRHLSDENALYKLTLNDDCKDFFRNDILGNPGVSGQIIKSHQRLSEAKTIFKEYLENKEKELGDSFFSWLRDDFFQKITQKIKVGIYIVDSTAEVGVIFEVMNNRGKDLTELEKVKNYLLYLTTKLAVESKEELEPLINETWSSIYQNFMAADLGKDSENNFLRAHWLMYANYSKKEWEGSKSIKKRFNLNDFRNRSAELFGQLKQYVQSLQDAAIAFADIDHPERKGSFNSFKDDESAQRSVIFHGIKLIRIKTIASFRPLLIACRLRFPNAPGPYLELEKLVEKFAFRVYNMEGKRADTGQSSIFKIAYDLYRGNITFDEACQQIKATLKRYSSPEKFKSYWDLDKLDNNWYNWSGIKYFLYEYEESLSENKPVTVPWNYFSEKPLENTIEHILPQTPNDPQNYWLSRFTPEEINLHIHDLGNLCLTYDNSSYRNHGFDIKSGSVNQESPCYAKSSLLQERELVQLYKDWTPTQLEQRRKKLTEWAVSRWDIDLSGISESDTDLPEEEYDED